MPSRRTCLVTLATLSASSLAGCGGPITDRDATTVVGDDVPTITVSSSAFEHGAGIPARYTCDGDDRSPPLTAAIPDDAETWALVVTDPDAPGGPFTHWLIWNLPPDGTLPDGVPRGETVPSLSDAVQGTNDFGDVGYGGPCPPAGDGSHTYVFDVYALGDTLDVASGSERKVVEDAIAADDAVVAAGTLTGTYER